MTSSQYQEESDIASDACDKQSYSGNQVNDIASDIARDARSYSRNHSPTNLQQQAFCLNGQRSVTACWTDDHAMVNVGR